MASKLGIVLFNLGGPDSLEAVQPFLRNLFADNDIIQLPFPQWLQNIFAWRVSNKRKAEAQENYEQIGGRSPILPLSEEQRDLLQQRLKQTLGQEVPIEIAMRYWHPMTDEALTRLRDQGVEELLLLPLYPHYSLATTGSSYRELDRAFDRLNWHPKTHTTCAYYDHPRFIDAMVERIQQGLDEHEWSCSKGEVHIVFSAHGLPRKYVQKNQDPYPKQIMQSAALIMQQGFPAQRWEVCFQSRVGPLEWYRPYTEDVIEELVRVQQDNVLFVPISFVSDHVETLFEMDKLYLPMAHEGGLKHIHRAPSLNDSALYIECLADLVQQAMTQQTACRIRFDEVMRRPGQPDSRLGTVPISLCSPRSIPLP